MRYSIWSHRTAALAATLAMTLVAKAASAQVRILDNGRIHIRLADPATGNTTVNPNRFDTVTWTNSSGTQTGNLAANGGSPVCNDPYETFGQARGDYTEEPRFIVAGTHAHWSQKAGTTLIGKTSTSAGHCKGVVLAGTVKSTYKLTSGARTINLLSIQRVFAFNGSGSGANADLRAFMPRLPDAQFDVVYVPSSTGAIQTYSANVCDGICQVTDWNGKWLADDDGNGNGVMVIRSPASTAASLVDVDHDGASNSNDSTIALTPPAGGWAGTVTETEYLCFYDPTTWTAGMRKSGKLPAGCFVKGI